MMRYEFRDQGVADAWARWLDCLFSGEVVVTPVDDVEGEGPGWAVLVAYPEHGKRKGRGHGA